MAATLADDIFKCIFLNEKKWISIEISRKFVSKGPTYNMPALVQIMACWLVGDNVSLIYWRIYASPGLDELSAELFEGNKSCIRITSFDVVCPEYSRLCAARVNYAVD